ncbi:MAG: 2-oxoacid:acceptor oxidoreductase family protein [Desulfomicrobium escambiense]|nr:2-oxoacid:acceptor oxidoreductase family protein [Desulfomicrobium escambiense]
MSGIGGQGILFSGLCLAWTAMLEGHHVTYLPSYGAEMRGGVTSCTIAISDEEIASPVASSPDYLVIMDNESLLRLQNQGASGGRSSSTPASSPTGPAAETSKLVEIPVNDIARSTVGEQYANMIMLGAFVNRTHQVKFSSMIDNMDIILGKGEGQVQGQEHRGPEDRV